MSKKDVIIFGYRDTLVGQVINHPDFQKRYNIIKILSFGELPFIDIKKVNDLNPVKTCEYVQNNMLFGSSVISGDSVWQYLESISPENNNSYEFPIGVFIIEDDYKIRKSLYDIISKKPYLNILNWIDPSCHLSPGSKIGVGTIVLPQVYVGYKVEIDKMCILQSGCRIEHHSKIKSFTNICPGFLCGGFVEIGEFCQIYIGVTIFNRISLGDNIQIGAGSLVTKSCESNYLYFGRPAKKIRKIF